MTLSFPSGQATVDVMLVVPTTHWFQGQITLMLVCTVYTTLARPDTPCHYLSKSSLFTRLGRVSTSSVFLLLLLDDELSIPGDLPRLFNCFFVKKG